MRYTKGENPMVVDAGNEPRAVEMCADCGTAIYEDDVFYDVGYTLCEHCGQAWFDEQYRRYALCV